MSHSKRNTALAFFTSYERSLLKDAWGSRSTRLNRDSFLPFGSCQLCLQLARDPVACALNGEIFCRECAVHNLLSQRTEIKRLQREYEKNLLDAAEERTQEDAIAQAEAVERFEQTMIGMDRRQDADTGEKRKRDESDGNTTHNVKSSDSNLPSFWVPSKTPTVKKTHDTLPPPKKVLSPLCPASSPDNKHALSLKTLVAINYQFDEAKKMVCPGCVKPLSNTIKAVMTMPCAHVLCKPCAGKLMTAETLHDSDPHAKLAKGDSTDDRAVVLCFVCSTDVTPGKTPSQPHTDIPAAAAAAADDDDDEATTTTKHKKRKKDKNSTGEQDAEALRPGLVELKCDGTGFAGKGRNMVQKVGTAFQC